MERVFAILAFACVIGLSPAWTDSGINPDDAGFGQDASTLNEWRALAAQGHVGAQHALGNAYFYGQGVTRDSAEAVTWYELAANKGYADAQNNLGLIYANGIGVAQDNIVAYMWWKLAADQGHADAQHALSVIGNRMTAAEIEAAKRRVAAWAASAP